MLKKQPPMLINNKVLLLNLVAIGTIRINILGSLINIKLRLLTSEKSSQCNEQPKRRAQVRGDPVGHLVELDAKSEDPTAVRYFSTDVQE